MSVITRIKILILVALSLLLLIYVYPSFRDNVQRVRVSKAYFASSSTDASAEQLRQVLRTACGQAPEIACESAASSSNKSAIEAADRVFTGELEPLVVIEDSAEFPTTLLSPLGPSTANQARPDSGTLYSAGYFQLRVFLESEAESCWLFSVRAMNDDPPPVNLALWLDNEEIGELSFTRGDQTWETLSVSSYVRPGAYWLRVWFVNDYLDRELNADRNAYIETIQIAKAEEALCEGN